MGCCAPRARFAEAEGFAVVELESAVRLREAGYSQSIALLEGVFDARELPVLHEHRLMPAIHTFEQIEMLSAVPAGAKLDVLLKVNTGMNRLGFQPGDFDAALAALQASPHVAGITLMTHFANADDAPGIAEPLRIFERITGEGRVAALARELRGGAAIPGIARRLDSARNRAVWLLAVSRNPSEASSVCGLR